MKKYYEQTVKLPHNKKLASVDMETGEVIEIPTKKNNIPEGKQLFGKEEVGWSKSFNASWEFLDEVLTDLEFRVVNRLCRMAKSHTNSLEPLDDETTAIELAEYFKIDRRNSKKMFNKLYELGVYGRFSVKKEDIPYTNYWVLNPYLTFQGSTIKSDIASLFQGTKLTNEYYKRQKGMSV
jgi:hypothetical protein